MSGSSRGIGLLNVGNRTNRAIPFTTGANNGLSVDPVSLKVTLGNNVGLSTAALLSNRFIPTNNFSLSFTDPLVQQLDIFQTAGGPTGVLMRDLVGARQSSINSFGVVDLVGNSALLARSPRIRFTNNAAATNWDLHNDAGIFKLSVAPAGRPLIWMDNAGDNFFFGDILNVTNGVFVFVDNPNKTVMMNNAAILTGNPSGNLTAVSPWELGTRIIAAAVLDATQYVEVSIGNTLFKLALIV